VPPDLHSHCSTGPTPSLTCGAIRLSFSTSTQVVGGWILPSIQLVMQSCERTSQYDFQQDRHLQQLDSSACCALLHKMEYRLLRAYIIFSSSSKQ
jgi:hypothetical protein